MAGSTCTSRTYRSDAMAEPRIIKKYPNRRLYDTELSRYITLNDLRKLVLEGGDFQVQDANTGEDITRTVLLQIITEQESEDKPLFTTDILMQMIRFYGGSQQGVFTNYLEKSLDLFVEQQQLYQSQLESMLSGDPVTAMTDITRRNLELWQDVQRAFMGASANAKNKEPPTK